jgi:hypothetical protein
MVRIKCVRKFIGTLERVYIGALSGYEPYGVSSNHKHCRVIVDVLVG